MALIHLTETFIPDLNQRKFATSRKITEADISKLTSDRLSESTRRYIEDLPSATLEGKTVWRVPISRYDWKNANGRVYEKKLWDRVIKEQIEAYQGNVGLADHPGDDAEGAFKEASVVWLNMGLDESNKLVWAECVFVGEHGHKAEEIMEVGGRVGFSSSGFGELSESDRSTVRWDTYQLERPADIVLNPSQHVFGKAGMKVRKENSGMHEATETKENETMSINESVVDTNTAVKLSKAEIRSFREQAESYLEGAKAILNPKERLDELNEIHSYWEESRMAEVATDLRERVEGEIKSAQGEIDKAITEHVKLKEDFGLDNVEQLKEGVKKVAVDTQLFKRDLDQWKTLAEGLQDKIQQYQAVLATRPTSEAYGNAMNQIKQVKEIAQRKETELLAEIGKLSTEVKKHNLIEQNMVKELTKITAERDKALEEGKILREAAKTLMAQLDQIDEDQRKTQKTLQEKVEAQGQIRIHPEGNRPAQFAKFNESKEVREYYSDLLKRHGADIKPFQEKILNCKTVKEAARVYLRALTSFDSTRTAHISEALDPAERRKLIEGQTGVKIAQTTTRFEKRLPEGWE